MLRALWYLIKIGLLVGVSIFLIVQPGQVMMEWSDYRVKLPIGYLAVGILILLFFVSFFSEMITRLSLWPSHLARARAEKRRVKGYRALMQSISAAATGDEKTAYYLAARAQKFLPETESGLPLLLQAQAMAKSGDGQNSQEPYQLLLKNADTALLGLQGLTQNAILSGDFAKALLLARKAYADNPKNQNLSKAVYDLEIKNRLWNDALVTLERHRKILLDANEIDKPIIYLMLGDMAQEAGRSSEAHSFYKKAYNHFPEFVPIVTRFAESLIESDKRRKALSVIDRAYKHNSHPDLVEIWLQTIPDDRKNKSGARYDWLNKLVDTKTDTEVSCLARARIAIEEQLWGEAKIALAQAEKIRPSGEVYDLWVKLEEQTNNRPDVIRQWLDRAYQSPSSGVWVCGKTGRSFKKWQAIIEPEGLFNTLIWDSDGIEKTKRLV
jgi:HemY protein